MILEDLIRRFFYGRKKEEKAATTQKVLDDPVLREVIPAKLQNNALLRLAIEISEQVSDLEETMQEIETEEKVTDAELAEIDELIDVIDPIRQRKHKLCVTLSEVCYRVCKRVFKDDYRMALCMQALGESQLTLNRPKLCLPPLKEAVSIFEDDEEWSKVVACYGNMGVAWRRLGDIETAAEYFQRALQIAEESGDELLVKRTEQWIKDFASGALPLEE
jgi:tetratricopeptide (TPR) repeat protein